MVRLCAPPTSLTLSYILLFDDDLPVQDEGEGTARCLGEVGTVVAKKVISHSRASFGLSGGENGRQSQLASGPFEGQ